MQQTIYRGHHIALAWLPDGSWRPSIDGGPLHPTGTLDLALALARHTVDQMLHEARSEPRLRLVRNP